VSGTFRDVGKVYVTPDVKVDDPAVLALKFSAVDPTFPVVYAGVPVHVGAVSAPNTSWTDPPSKGT
jgi:hypothetical protein